MKKRTSFQIFTSVVMALFLREVQTKFGTKKLGYFWAIFDPMSQVIIFSTIKMALSDRAMQGMDYPVFLATSFLTYNIFKVALSSQAAFKSNKALFSYKQVKPFDAIVSRYLLEFLVMCLTIIIFLLFGLYIDLDIGVKNLNMVLLAVAWFTVFSFGIGLLIAVLSTFYETFAKLIGVMGLPLFFVSGLMFTVDSLPPTVREYLLYNPVLHFMEMIHGNYFNVLDTRYVDYTYMFLWTIIPLFIGLFFYIRSEKKIIAS